MQEPLYQIKNPGELPLPKPIIWLMYAVFSLPLVVIPMTISSVPESPMILLAWPVCFFPLGLMWALKRLMGRYAITVFHDGRLEVTLPFKTDRFGPGVLRRVGLNQVRMHVGGGVSTRTFVQLIGDADQLLTQFDASAFAADQVEGLLQALRQINPQLPIH